MVLSCSVCLELCVEILMQETPITSYQTWPLWLGSQHMVTKVVTGFSICVCARQDLNWRDLHAQCDRCDRWACVSEAMQEAFYMSTEFQLCCETGYAGASFPSTDHASCSSC